MFVVLGGSVTSVDRCGSVTVTIALMLTTLDNAMKDCMKPVMKGKTVQRINCAEYHTYSTSMLAFLVQFELLS